MKSVFISIKPKWCELIANGKKSIEIRKTRPKIDTPFKCYIYCTKESYKGKYLHTSDKQGRLLFWENPNDTIITVQPENYHYMAYACRGKVIGEFICDNIIQIDYNKNGYGLDSFVINGVIAKSCVSEKELYHYLNGAKPYLWHISDLVIYDQPKELSEFWEGDKCPYATGDGCTYQFHCYRSGEIKRCEKPLTRPPQSWCYVEKEENK